MVDFLWQRGIEVGGDGVQTPSTNQMTGDRQTDKTHTHTAHSNGDKAAEKVLCEKWAGFSPEKQSAHKHRLLESVWRKVVTGGHREKGTNTAQLLHCPCLCLACMYSATGFRSKHSCHKKALGPLVSSMEDGESNSHPQGEGSRSAALCHSCWVHTPSG